MQLDSASLDVTARLARAAALAGRVYDAADKSGVEGVDLELVPFRGAVPLVETRSGIGGTYELRSIPDGWYRLEVRPQRHVGYEMNVEVAADEVTRRDVPLVAGWCVRGRVVDEATRQPLAPAAAAVRTGPRDPREAAVAGDPCFPGEGLAAGPGDY